MTSYKRVFGSVILLVVVSLVAGCLPAGGVLGKDGEGAGTPLASLDGTQWDLIELEGAPVTGPGPATLGFTEGLASGISFCNSFSAPYEQDGASLSFGEMVSTLMMCMDAGPEAEYLAALGTVASAAIEDANLVLSDGSGEAVLVYAPAEDAPFEATTWVLTGILQNGGVSSTALGTEVTATLEDGMLAGSAGCNRYSAPVTVDGADVAIGPAASTRMFCAEPESVMDQEQAYLAALEQAVRYEISRNMLRLYDAAGLPVLTFTVLGE